MHNLDCPSIHNNQDADFHQLSILVKDIRDFLDPFRAKQGSIIINSFEISRQLTRPLENLDDLFVTLFKETEPEINEQQRKYLTICERVVAVFYCYIHHFCELQNLKNSSKTSVYTRDYDKQLAYEFYYNAAYELRTPCNILKGYNQILVHMGEIYSPPLVPENQDKLDQIYYWIDELGNFTNDLPRLWKANRQEETA